MFQVVPKWRVSWTNSIGSCIIYISDNHMGNVLRKVADISFSPSGIENEPTEIKIEKVN